MSELGSNIWVIVGIPFFIFYWVLVVHLLEEIRKKKTLKTKTKMQQ